MTGSMTRLRFASLIAAGLLASFTSVQAQDQVAAGPAFGLTADGVVDYGYIPGDRFELRPEHAANPQLFAQQYPMLAQRMWSGAMETPTAGIVTYMGNMPAYQPITGYAVPQTGYQWQGQAAVGGQRLY